MQNSFTEIKWDYIVVGSGPSGGRIAHDLVKSGAKVLLLEAGRYFKTTDFPKPEIESSSQMFWGGGVELNHDARLGFLRAKCVGGTSLVNQALFDRFDEEAWSEWRDISGIKDFNETDFSPIYEEVEQSLSIQTIDKKYFGRNTDIFIQAFEKKNFGWAALRRGQRNCGLDQGQDCIVCLGGCGRGSKQSSMVTAVEPALALGLSLLADCEVQAVKESERGVQVSALLKNRTLRTSEKIDLQCGALVLAGGSFGTTKILLQSGFKKQLPALGAGLSCHPQYMTFALFERPVEAYKGAFQAVKSYDKKLRAMGFKFENVFAPPIATAMLLDGFGREHQAQMNKFRFMASMEVAIRDEASGEMLTDQKNTVRKSLTGRDRERMAQGQALIVEMFESVGAQRIIRCEQAFGLHLMGGCAIGQRPEKSVVNPEFQLHGYKKIFIADSSIFPSAPGINPSLTIMALSQRALPHIKKAV